MKKIYAIPGLGTTKELFRELKINNAQLIVLEWPVPTGNETLKSYSERFIEKIDTGSPFCLMGVSFGGMICVELNDILKPEKTFLISSAKCRKELPPIIRLFKFLRLPTLLSEKTLRFINAHSRAIIGFGKEFLSDFIAMMDSMPNNYYRYCGNYIVNWKREVFGKNIIHIHGTDDKLLKFKYVKADHIIEGGTHSMVVYRAPEIARIIESYL